MVSCTIRLICDDEEADVQLWYDIMTVGVDEYEYEKHVAQRLQQLTINDN